MIFNNKLKKIVLTVLSVFVIFSAFGQRISPLQQRKLSEVLSFISQLYVDTINDNKLTEAAIRAMLEELDPHSTYTAKEEVQRMREPLEGSFEGIGIHLQMIKDTANVMQTVSGTPAEKVGMLTGDKVIYINGELVAGVKVLATDISKKLRGPKGTSVDVGVLRGNERLDFKIIRDKIPVLSIDVYYMLTDKIGFIKVNNFGATTANEFKEAVKKLKTQGMEDLVLSFEGNGGGLLTAAISIIDDFLGENKMAVYTEGINSPRNEAKTTAVGEFEKGRVVVLINEYSASASEIVSGALQDWDRAVLVGRRSYGKGLVQRQIPLVDSSLVRLTIAHYYTPTGRSIQKSYNKGSKDYGMDIVNRLKNGELMHPDSIHFDKSLQYRTKIQGRTVYGGGGIMPDVFVPLDTIENTLYHRKIVAKGVTNRFVLQYINGNRAKLEQKYPTFSQFKKEFEVTDELVQQLVKDAEKEGVAFDKKEFDRSKRKIKLQLKALIANNIWGPNEAQQVFDTDSKTIKRAIEILTTEGAYDKILMN